MAVTPAVLPNLAGNYANIQNALQQRADIAGRDYGIAGHLAAVVDPLGEEAVKRRDEYFKAGLEDHLNKNKSIYAAQAEGKTLTTPDNAATFAKNMGLDPDKAAALVPDEGVWQTPEQKLDIASRLKRGDTIEKMAQQFEAQGDIKRANLIRLAGRSTDPQADQMIMRINGMGAVEVKQDPATKTLHVYDKMSGADMGQVPGATTPSDGAAVHLFDDIPSLRKVDGKQADALQEVSKTALNDPALKPTAKDLDDLAALRRAVVKNNPTSGINIRADLARDIGGVPGGRFSSILSSVEGTDPSISAQMGNYFSTKFTGGMSKQIQGELLDQIDSVAENRKTQLASALMEKHQAIKAQAPYASDDLIASQLGYQRYLKPVETPLPAPSNRQAFKTAEDVKAAFRAGQLSKEDAIKILSERFGMK